MGLSQSNPIFGPDETLVSDITKRLVELENKYSTRKLTGKECTQMIKQLAEEQAAQLGKDNCKGLMEQYSKIISVVEQIKSAIKYSERRFVALTKGPRCVNQSPDVTDYMDVPSADLTQEQCNKIRAANKANNYIWKETLAMPNKEEQVNKGWYDIVTRAYTDINKILKTLADMLEEPETIDEDKVSTLVDVIKKNADDAYVEAIKYDYTQNKVARANVLEDILKRAETTQGGGGKGSKGRKGRKGGKKVKRKVGNKS